ncbi:MAG: LysR family transcriptional regulator [Muribaculaceae bacterium]|nr:LysR family transcriptional regulator [Muribaculaceae bacterium]
MELRQLRYFVKVAETLSFSEAAKALYITQGTLSQQIKQLEAELGTQLFIRTSRSVCLTETGSVMLPYARRTIADADGCMARIADINNMAAGTLNIGVTYSFSPILTETIITFRKLYPAIKLNIFYKPMAELMDMLTDREVDFALAFRPSQPVEGVESHILFQNYLAAIVGEGHPLAGEKSISLDKLAAYDLALPSQGLQARNAFDSVAAPSAGYRIRLELNEVNILLKIIRNTSLVSVLAEATIHNEKGVAAVPLDFPQNEMAGCVHLLSEGYRKRSMQAFIKLLSESVAVRERQNAWL